MFKKLIAMVITIETNEDFNRVWGEIDIAYQHEKISWKDHQMLAALIAKITIND